MPEAFLHPDREDPLDSVVRAGVSALPREPRTTGLVAVLADWTIDLDECVQDGRLDADAFERRLFQGDGFDRTPFERIAHGGVTVFRPIDELATEAALADRVALGAAMRRIVADRGATLQNWPAVQFALYPSHLSLVKQRYFGEPARLGMRTLRNTGPYTAEMFALVGAAMAQGTATVDASGPPFRDLIRDGILHRWLLLTPASATSALDDFPSTRLVSGVLDGARIRLAESSRSGFDSVTPGDTIGFQGRDIGQLRPNPLYPDVLQHLRPVPRSETRTRALFERAYLHPTYRLGRVVDLHAEVQLRGGLTGRMDLRDDVVERTGLTFAQLPDEYRDAFLASVRKGLEQEGIPVPKLYP